ncbi:metallo-beta-lactamase superfamily protein [Mycobacterium xenopi 4042]|uniref:Metallo-beta-lactamase superfamily protein n=1 Tax=Mycobacterium xenopi 4042 TaxID=1299334 RepID=X7ZXA3_MYCXE|nr:metallo-beta-lactamase superfamily protein [Mycobacterium xenopi 4042]
MQLTHFGHSCLLAAFDHTAVLFDPGNFSHGFEGISGLAAILITHQHPDHVDTARLPALIDANPAPPCMPIRRPPPSSARRVRPCG